MDGLVGALERLGHRVDLITLRTKRRSLALRLLLGLALQVAAVRRLRACDVVYVRMHPTACLLPVLLFPQRPYIVECNGVIEDYVAAHPSLGRYRRLMQRAVGVLLRRATLVVAVTEGLARHLRSEIPGATVAVVPNAADPRRFHPDHPRPADVPDGPYALFFGALAPWQGIDLAVEAALHDQWPAHVPLVVIGDGPARETASAAARATPARVAYLGARAPEDLPAYVAHAAFTVVPKQYHDPAAGQSPLKLYESVMAGTPVVATHLHGCTDVSSLEAATFACEPTPVAIADTARRCMATSEEAPEGFRRTLEAVRTTETWDDRARRVEVALERYLK